MTLEHKKLTDVYEIYPELTREVLAHDIRIIFLVYGSRNLQQMTKNDFFFSAICTGIHGTKCNCVLQWMLVHRDPKRAAFNKRTVLNWFLCAINARNLSWAGLEQGGHPEWVRSLWEPVSRKRGMASHTAALMQHKSTAILQWEKQLHLVRRFGHFLRRLIRTRSHGEMVISTETDF